MNKMCSICKTEKELNEFAKNSTRKDGLQDRCRACHSLYVKEHYKKNTSYYRDKAKIRNKKVRVSNLDKLFDYLSTHPCMDCGETDIIVLEFDHIFDNKSYNIAEMTGNKRWDEIEAEIEKCEVRCANCHRRVTAQRGNYYVIEYLASIA